MSSLIEELRRREAAARQEADELRREIAELSGRLAGAEKRVSKLEFARETVAEILGESAPDRAEGVLGRREERAADREPESLPFGRNSPIGVQTVLPWHAGLDISALPRAYQDLVEVLSDAPGPLRAGQVAAAAGLSTDKSKVEGLRSKLKRLVERGWLAEDGAGFTAIETRPGGDVNP
ncbi:hypothetical protein [Streptomyces mirabilis]